MAELIFELGTEELPAGFIDPALAWLEDNVKKALTDARLSFGAVTCEGTPRRLAVLVRDLAERTMGSDCDALFIGCSQLPTRDALPGLAQRFGKPALSSIQATAWQAMRVLEPA